MYVLLTGKMEEIYLALFQIDSKILPLNYYKLKIIKDFELAQINVTKLIFKESVYQGCYFHFCQVMNLSGDSWCISLIYYIIMFLVCTNSSKEIYYLQWEY